MSTDQLSPSSERVLPHADEVTAEFWAAARRGEIVVQFCDECLRFVHPPRAQCPGCGHAETLSWKPVSGRGRIHSAARVTREFSVGIPVPYVPITVELVEQDELVLWSRLSGSTDLPEIGALVTAVFEQVTDEVTLINFGLDG